MALVVWALLGASATLGEDTSPQSQPLVELGRTLFFDASLSADGKVSCAACHRPELGYADGRDVGQGAWGRKGTRNVPTLLDLEDHSVFNWDGRTTTLEEQVLAPYTTAVEHGLSNLDEVVARVSANAAYGPLVEKAFSAEHAATGISKTMIAGSLAAYVRSIPGNTAPQRYAAHPVTATVPANVERGRTLFGSVAGCATCHRLDGAGIPTTDNEYHALGHELASIDEPLSDVLHRHQQDRRPISGDSILGDRGLAALGRFNTTGDPQDIARFRTPSLRHAATTAPYFHDGGVSTLEEAVELELYYRRSAGGNLPAISRDERDDLIAYIRWIADPRR